jgi:predicted nucleic acid-binding protein
MRYFFDTSAIAKAYCREIGSAEVVRILAEPESEFLISSLAAVELQSAFAKKVRMGQITLDDFDFARRKLGGELRSRRIRVKCLFRRHQSAAEDLIVKYRRTRGLRTLDALQLAMAIELASRSLSDCFVVTDAQLLDVASLEGIKAVDRCAT